MKLPVIKIDKYIGLFGIFLKKKSPGIYYKLKKLEIKLKNKNKSTMKLINITKFLRFIFFF